MHMSDALISPGVGGAMFVASATIIGLTIRKISPEETREKLPFMAVLGAFTFAAQMINFTIPGTGASGHLSGAILLAAVLGTAPALMTIAAIRILQCLLFADGGLLALGANIFNMGILPICVAWPLMSKLIRRDDATHPEKRMRWCAITAAITGLLLGATGVVLETIASGVTAMPFATFATLMLPIHAIIGTVEGVVTAAIILYIQKVRPELLNHDQKTPPKRAYPLILTATVATILTAGGLSWFASTNPDGLEWAIEKNLDAIPDEDALSPTHQSARHIQETTTLMPDYDFDDQNARGTATAGLLGAAATAALALALGAAVAFIRRRKNNPCQP